MDHSGRIGAVERELRDLQRAVAGGDGAAEVPTCPGWTVVDLAHHVGGFCAFWTHALCEGTGSGKPTVPDDPPGDAVVPWLAERGEQLLEQLGRTSADTPVWTWFDADQSAGFVARRAANELGVHRYDAQSARGTCAPLDPLLAIDAIDETFDALVTRRPRTGVPTGQTLHLHGTDEGIAASAASAAGATAGVPGTTPTSEWLVTLQPDRIDVSRTHAKGDLAVRGAVSDLALLLYRRPTLGPVQRFGDDAVLDLWYNEFIF